MGIAMNPDEKASWWKTIRNPDAVSAYTIEEESLMSEIQRIGNRTGLISVVAASVLTGILYAIPPLDF